MSTMTLTVDEAGWSPASITIAKGEDVTFYNNYSTAITVAWDSYLFDANNATGSFEVPTGMTGLLMTISNNATSGRVIYMVPSAVAKAMPPPKPDSSGTKTGDITIPGAGLAASDFECPPHKQHEQQHRQMAKGAHVPA